MRQASNVITQASTERDAVRTGLSEGAAEFLVEPILTLWALGTTVVPAEHQRFIH